MAKNPKAERIWKHQSVGRAEFLTNRLSHLEGEVGRCIPVLFAAKTGFWATARMLFPIIEATSEAVAPAMEDKKPAWLLGELGIVYPRLVWEMYRNTLMHNDEMFVGGYQGRPISWSVSLGGGHGGPVQGHLHVDLELLYKDFVAFLTEEIAAAVAQPSQLIARGSFEFNEGFAKATRDEAIKLTT